MSGDLVRIHSVLAPDTRLRTQAAKHELTVLCVGTERALHAQISSCGLQAAVLSRAAQGGGPGLGMHLPHQGFCFVFGAGHCQGATVAWR